MRRLGSTDGATPAMHMNVIAHFRPVVMVLESVQHFLKSKVASDFASMMQMKQFLPQCCWHIDSVVLHVRVPIIENSVELFTVGLHGPSSGSCQPSITFFSALPK